ncbi:hypothetical protein [Deinococcus cellulosilyticus]|uniref:Uncharacterized protein n=1 Tax=Deinococcus cellulosilyticus (strain DSM 18568 / NBRC 106333 / KACC 11606 / 5516J-15) TaxID=1223518 RepID=A0A511N6T9_DEIC1|nr:hypothetical protein [Deinococcus cellulosilyticus]GEM48565.1 hypothetical protein DC3_42000 [Deinococcus cellulosilyticus NBRC 106333 = KACC 11606]
MRHGCLLGVILLVLGIGQAAAETELFTLNVKNHCENSMDIFIDGAYVGTVEQEGQFAIMSGEHMLYARNTIEYADATVVADQDYDWMLCH